MVNSLQLLLVELAELNITLRAEQGQLHINAPSGVLSDSIKQALRQHREALLARLQQASNAGMHAEWPNISSDVENRQEPFPLSDVQHAYWIGRSKGIELGDVATHYYYELSCDNLDINRFARAFRILIQRHDMLRAIVDHDGQQRILEKVPSFDIAVDDLRNKGRDQQESRLLALRTELSHQKLPTHLWPLFDIRAARLSHRNTRVYFSWDFLNLDAWSLYTICREWNILYANPDASLAPIGISYRDYVLAERALRVSDAYRRDHDYWWQRLDSIPGAPMLPIRPAAESGGQPRFTRMRFRMEKEKWNRLKGRSRALGVTPSSLLLAAYAEVLAYWSKQPHFSLNMTLFSRLPLHADINKLVGDFTSLTLLEVDMRKRSSFRQRAIDIQKQFLRDFEHRLVSGVEVLREWSKRKGHSLQAVMPVVFTSCLVLNSTEGDDAGLLESFGPMVYGISQTPQVWLDNQIMEDKDGLVLNWDALQAVFAPEVLENMFNSYCEFLHSLALSAMPWEEAHPLELPAEQAVQRTTINDTKADVFNELLHEGFINHAVNHPDDIALISSRRQMSYGELLTCSVAMAEALSRQGLETGQLVAVVMNKSWEQIAAVLGVLIAGGSYLPVDPELPRARRHQLFDHSGASLAVVAPGAEEQLGLPAGIQVVVFSEAIPDGRVMHTAPALRQGPEDVAYVIFTSGSTGIPKGVVIGHRGAVNTVRHINRLFHISRHDRLLAVSSLSFDLSVYDIFGTLAAGGTMVLPDAKRCNDPEHWYELMQQHAVTIWNSAPPLMTMLVSYMEGFHKGPCTTLRLGLLSGDWVPVNLKGRTDRLLPDMTMISLGGATEASIWSIYYPVSQVQPGWSSIPYGRPLPNQSMHVLNDQLRPCPVNVVGAIYIGGMGLAMGYLNDEEKTKRHFIAVDGERLYYTGDLGRYQVDGNIEFLGREDSQIKLRGHRIELGEITSVLQSHPAVREALVVVDGDSRSDQALWAYLQLEACNQSMLMTPVQSPHSNHEYSPDNIARIVGDEQRRSPITNSHQDSIDLWTGLDALYFVAMCGAFDSMHAFSLGARHSVDTLMQDMRIVPRYRRWVRRALQALVNSGILAESDGNYTMLRDFPKRELSRYARASEQRLMQVLSLTEREASWFTHSAEKLPELLTEATHSAEIYTADETASIYQKLFPDSHVQLSRAVSALAALRKHEKLRVLEIGAGLGSATRHLLPVLKRCCEVYEFTDVSNFFLKKARESFAQYPFVQYSLYDLEKPPACQGYDPHSYDLIVASSVLHDVRDVARTLVHLRDLLTPGGTLMLLEETRFFPWFDLTMGLQQGFDVYTDEGLRQQHPLLTRWQWDGLLRDAGFPASDKLTVEGSAADYLGFDVFIAQAPGQVDRLDEHKLNGYLLERLPAYMKPTGYFLLPEFPLTSNGKIDYQALARPARKHKTAVQIDKPSSDSEGELLTIWCGVLGRDDISVNHSFFEIGGDSLSLVEVRNQIKLKMGRHVPTTTLFEYPTISGLAKYMAGNPAETADFSEAQKRGDKQKKALQKRRAAHKGVVENA